MQWNYPLNCGSKRRKSPHKHNNSRQLKVKLVKVCHHIQLSTWQWKPVYSQSTILFWILQYFLFPFQFVSNQEITKYTLQWFWVLCVLHLNYYLKTKCLILFVSVYSPLPLPQWKSLSPFSHHLTVCVCVCARVRYTNNYAVSAKFKGGGRNGLFSL